jgi:hypothetical protein
MCASVAATAASTGNAEVVQTVPTVPSATEKAEWVRHEPSPPPATANAIAVVNAIRSDLTRCHDKALALNPEFNAVIRRH